MRIEFYNTTEYYDKTTGKTNKVRALTFYSDKIIQTLSVVNECDTIPTMSLTLPWEYLSEIGDWCEIKVFWDDYCFWGIPVSQTINPNDGTLTLELDHIVSEWEYEYVAMGSVISRQSLNTIYKTDNEDTKWENYPKKTAKIGDGIDWYVKSTNGEMRHLEESDYAIYSKKTKVKWFYRRVPRTDSSEYTVNDQLKNICADVCFYVEGWTVELDEQASEYNMVFYGDKVTKLQALNEILGSVSDKDTTSGTLTNPLHWRVPLVDKRVIEIGAFGEEKDFMVSKMEPSSKNAKFISQPEISIDNMNRPNCLFVTHNTSTTSYAPLSLRPIYADSSAQLDRFPVVNFGDNYSKFISTNNYYEYAILDLDAIEMNGGRIIQGSVSYSDYVALNIEDYQDENGNSTITNKDRFTMAATAYYAGVNALISNRRCYTINCETSALPSSVKVGDRIILSMKYELEHISEKRPNMQHFLTEDELFYITAIEHSYSQNTNIMRLKLETSIPS